MPSAGAQGEKLDSRFRGNDEEGLGGMKRLAVYCGSSMGSEAWFGGVARALGEEMARRGIALVYGGGHRGLMGVVADSVLAGRALYADELVTTLAPDAGLRVIAVASQGRPHFHEPTRAAFRRRPRSEHLILLGKAPSSTTARATRRGPPERDRPRGARGR